MWMQRYIVTLCLVQALAGLVQGNSRDRPPSRGQGRNYKIGNFNMVNNQDAQTAYNTDDGAGQPSGDAGSNRGGLRAHRGRHHHNNAAGATNSDIGQVPPGAGEPGQCPECKHVDIRKIFRIQQIKQRFLSATGLGTEPNMTGVVKTSNPNVEDLINRVERRQHDSLLQDTPSYDDEPEVKTEKIFVPVEPVPSGLNIPDTEDVLYFKLKPEQVGIKVKRAILHVWLRHNRGSRVSNSQVKVTLFKVSKPDLRPRGQNIKKTEVITVQATQGSWVKIHMLKVLQEWLELPSSNMGIVVSAPRDSNGEKIVQIAAGQKEAPLLEIHTIESKRGRNKRNTGNRLCSESSRVSNCCRHPLVVNFVDLGWDFIVAPKVYEANFCNGDCPYLYAHKYAHFNLLQKMNDTKAKHGPCCGARKLSPMQMLYYDHDHQIKFDTIQDMVVDRCGCS